MGIPFLNQVSFLEKILFAKNLALMIKSGLSLREAVVTLQEQSKSKVFKEILHGVIKNIDNGRSLADSLAGYPGVFDPLYINMIRIGEESGGLEENLNYLASQLEKSYQLSGKVKGAMVYPAIIILAVVILSLALIFFILPKVTPIFQSLNIELPLTTRILIKFTEIVENYGFLLLVGVIGLIFISILLLRIQKIKFLSHKLTLKIPIMGQIFRDVSIAQFGRTLGILLRSGIPVVQALDITQNTLVNLVYQKELAGITEEVKKGKSISDYLKKKETAFPLMVSRLVGVGEKTGSLEETLLYIGDFYEAEVDKSTKTLSSTVEPILLLIIGLAVGLIAVAIISPIYEITRGLHL